jgi:hypothetical protein
MPDQYLSLGSMLFDKISNPAVQALPVVQGMPIDPATGMHGPFPGFQALTGKIGADTLGQALRPFPQYQQEPNSQLRRFYEGVGVSSYNSLQIKANKRFSNGLSFLVSYTWSKTLTDAEALFGEFSGFTQDAYNRKAEKGLSINDYPSNLVISYQYELPVGPGKKFANVGGSVGKVVGGWNIAAIQQYQSGPPQLLISGGNSMWPYDGPNSFMIRPNVVPGVPKKSAAVLNGTYDANRDSQFNIKAWSLPAAFTYGNAPRTDGAIRRFPYFNEDISLIKRTRINERVNVEFRADFLNIFNRTVLGFDQGGDQYGSVLQGGIVSDPVGFGHVGSQGNYPREIQFGLKINY